MKMDEQTLGGGRRYLQETRYSRRAWGPKERTYPRAHPFKSYPEAQARVELPPRPQVAPADLWDTLARRRSLRHYGTGP